MSSYFEPFEEVQISDEIEKNGEKMLPIEFKDLAKAKGLSWSSYCELKIDALSETIGCKKSVAIDVMRNMVSKELREKCSLFDQEHLLYWLDSGRLSLAESWELATYINDVDMAYVKAIWQGAKKESAPVEISPLENWVSTNDPRLDAWRLLGLGAIQRISTAAVILAGGQGTRLGFNLPKGCFQMKDLPSKPHLFEAFAKRLLKVTSLAQAKMAPRLIIMTSYATDKDTKKFFESNNYFGLDAQRVHFVPQGTMPALSLDHHLNKDQMRIMLATKSTLALAPNGNGGIYQALAMYGYVDLLEEEGVQYIHIFSVDNLLGKPCDPVFIGFCIAHDATVASKVVPKCSPDERVGVMAKKNGRTTVVEYSELDPQEAKRCDPFTGRLLYIAGNICNHCVTPQFLTAAASVDPHFLPYHLARKKISTPNPKNGTPMIPDIPNAIKLETFIFDAFTLCDDHFTLECSRAHDFAPVKNASGNDSPGTATAALLQRGALWLKDAGAIVLGDCGVDIPPELSYDGEGLDHLQGRIFDASEHPLLLDITGDLVDS
mmetsp:Transcript_4189/g.5887  ORF Transcript_4189/g.5887 Transcript_4189/m.5887 type:complete len:547 (-) Transcript_4189:115-1755(-)